METFTTVGDVIQFIEKELRVEITEVDNDYEVSIRSGKSAEFRLSHERIQLALNELEKFSPRNQTTIFNENKYEVLVREERAHYPASFLRRDFPLEQEDADNNLTYKLGHPSDAYLLFLINEISKITSVRRSLNTGMMRRRRSENEDTLPDLLDSIATSSSRMMTLTILSSKRRTISEYEKLATSFFFHFSYNLDVALIPQRYLDEFARVSRISSVRRSKIEDLDVPKRSYNPDIVYHYQQAVASESPPLEFLSYYHVLEHFFASVFEDDLLNRVVDHITKPDFSYKRKTDIKSLIKEIEKSYKFRQDNITFSEPEALLLTLKKYVDFPALADQVREYDHDLIEHYRSNAVSFSGGDKFDLENADVQQQLRKLQNRIYKTRNAIVHSKDNGKQKYKPFEHDQLLVKEVPLIRFIAEQIVIKDSDLLNL